MYLYVLYIAHIYFLSRFSHTCTKKSYMNTVVNYDKFLMNKNS